MTGDAKVVRGIGLTQEDGDKAGLHYQINPSPRKIKH